MTVVIEQDKFRALEINGIFCVSSVCDVVTVGEFDITQEASSGPFSFPDVVKGVEVARR